MSRRLVARRYAKALLDLAIAEGTLETLREELKALAALIQSNADLNRLVYAPLIPPSRKAATLDAILAQAGLSETARRFLKVVTESARLAYIQDIVDAFETLVDVHRGVLEAEVTTAHPLSEPQSRTLAELLGKRTGATIRLRCHQDASILGGLKLRLGSTIYDASLQGQLRQLKARLLNA